MAGHITTPYSLQMDELDSIEDVDVSSPSDGDIIRWDSVDGKWESRSEPFEFTQIILTPRATPVSDMEGGLYYDSDDDHVYVGTEV